MVWEILSKESNKILSWLTWKFYQAPQNNNKLALPKRGSKLITKAHTQGMLGKTQIQTQNRLSWQDTKPGISVVRNQRRARVCDRSDCRNASTEATEFTGKARSCWWIKNPTAGSGVQLWQATPRRLPGARHNCLGRPRDGEAKNEGRANRREKSFVKSRGSPFSLKGRKAAVHSQPWVGSMLSSYKATLNLESCASTNHTEKNYLKKHTSKWCKTSTW